MVGGQTVQANGTACQQPDGTWKVTQETPGQLQPQVFVAPPPPADYYAYPYPWWAPLEIGIGGTFVFHGGGGGDHGRWRSGWHGR
jgi:hypothetical protein